MAPRVSITQEQPRRPPPSSHIDKDPKPDTQFEDVKLNVSMKTLMEYHLRPEPYPYTPIGAGATSSAFIDHGRDGKKTPGCVFRVERSHPAGSLKREWKVSNELLDAQEKYEIPIGIPEPQELISDDDGWLGLREWWWNNWERFPEGTPHNTVLVLPIIPSFSSDAQEVILATTKPGSCPSSSSSTPPPAIPKIHPLLSLPGAQHTRLPPTHLLPSELDSLEMSPHVLAEAMASLYALSLFAAEVDPHGVIFAIVPAVSGTEEEAGTINSSTLGAVTLQTTSLSRSSPLCLCQKGISLAVERYLAHEQVPKPTGIVTTGLSVRCRTELDEDEIWKTFRRRFVDVGRTVLRKRGLEKKVFLVADFVKGVETGAFLKLCGEERKSGSCEGEVSDDERGMGDEMVDSVELFRREVERRREMPVGTAHMCPKEDDEWEWDVVKAREATPPGKEDDDEDEDVEPERETFVGRTRRVVGDLLGMSSEIMRNLDQFRFSSERS